MQDSKLEQKIEDIYSFVESCNMKSFSSTKVIVPKNDLYDLLDELRRALPTEIERYRKILNQKDAILEDARKKGNAILADAKAQYSAMVEEHAIVQQARQQADYTIQEANARAAEIVETAKNQVGEMERGALGYTYDMLNATEKAIAQAYQSTVNNAKALETALRGHLEIISKNKAELGPSVQQEQAPRARQTAAAREQKQARTVKRTSEPSGEQKGNH